MELIKRNFGWSGRNFTDNEMEDAEIILDGAIYALTMKTPIKERNQNGIKIR